MEQKYQHALIPSCFKTIAIHSFSFFRGAGAVAFPLRKKFVEEGGPSKPILFKIYQIVLEKELRM